MHLKTLEITGFKSFPQKTKLEFEPGMTSIVGPNGCGKSNVSDAIRWVLGEQSPKALRGSKMEDCIFNGTDSRRPLGMAEVVMTLTDCEEALSSEYNEVTITRRVFRSGEGQYFLNKTSCRLKDIQRLFMDTGIGTSSYSLMEQGRIDQILSSRPEDRRTVFEEASGITKFKADKKEALRKLEHTEANLLRLADVIREVKRQIGSLQRQAGKARRYKESREELRRLDVYTAKERLKALAVAVQATESDMVTLDATIKAECAALEQSEQGATALRERLMSTEREIASALEAGVQARSNLDHSHELIRVNQQRVEEYRRLADRDSLEVDENRKRIEQKRGDLDALLLRVEENRTQQREAEQAQKACTERFEKHRQDTDATRIRIQRCREQAVELETQLSRLQNEVMELEARQRSSVIQKERLTAEKAQLTRVVQGYAQRQDDMVHTRRDLAEAVTHAEETLATHVQRKAELASHMRSLQQANADLRSQAAGKAAQLDLLAGEDADEEGFPPGARLLLDGSNPLELSAGAILGALATELDVEPAYRTAVEVAMRSWLDAVLVADLDAAMAALRALEARAQGAARLLALCPNTDASPLPATPGDTDRLIDHVTCSNAVMPAVRRLIGNVFVVPDIDAFPAPIPAGLVFVTPTGALARGDGSFERWTRDASTGNPLSRKHMAADNEASLADINRQIETYKATITKVIEEEQGIDAAVDATRSQLDKVRQTLAQKEGENQVVGAEASEARSRLETVVWELDELTQSSAPDDEQQALTARKAEALKQQADVATQIRELSDTLRDMESRQADLHTEVTDGRVRLAELSQRLEHSESRCRSEAETLKEVEIAVERRSAGVQSCQSSIDGLTTQIQDAEGRLTALQDDVKVSESCVENLRKNRDKKALEMAQMEKAVAARRTTLEEARGDRAALEVRAAENKMSRQNLIERTTQEYNITQDQMMEEPEPEWQDGRPDTEALETSIAELRTRIEAMGPVNLVAIEEHQELQERYSFLTEQEDDLVKSKQQLMDMIRTINRTTTEMFQTTFEQVNTNFQEVYRKLFNGGSAKLVLVDEEDVLESGIEIIARPPGKRLQNVSLLSGGERTLTAVALLFAIYLIKPSPFCVLDELDAALDDSNIGRFVEVLREFLVQSQFVVITHNRQTIAAADALYGVTMQERGVSKIVSMRFRELEKDPVHQPA